MLLFQWSSAALKAVDAPLIAGICDFYNDSIWLGSRFEGEGGRVESWCGVGQRDGLERFNDSAFKFVSSYRCPKINVQKYTEKNETRCQQVSQCAPKSTPLL